MESIRSLEFINVPLLIFKMILETNIYIFDYFLGIESEKWDFRVWRMDILRTLQTYCQIICWKKWLNFCSLSSSVPSFVHSVFMCYFGSRELVVNKGPALIKHTCW